MQERDPVRPPRNVEDVRIVDVVSGIHANYGREEGPCTECTAGKRCGGTVIVGAVVTLVAVLSLAGVVELACVSRADVALEAVYGRHDGNLYKIQDLERKAVYLGR